jgi:hypothetical protein
MKQLKEYSSTLTDAQLHELARKRVEFRKHLVVYCVIIGFLWALWFITGQGYIWPVWPMGGWGVGLAFHYLFEYRSFKTFSEEYQYNRLKQKMESPTQS